VKRRLFGIFALLLAVPAHAQPAEQGSGAQISPVQGEPNKNAGNKPDRSLIPGLQAELKAALDEAASAKDTALAAKKELDQRMTENNHWKDEIAAVDKDKATYESQVKDYNQQADTHQSRRAELKARCPEKVNSASVAAACNAEWAPVNQEGHNLTAWRDRLNQAKADLQTRYTNINNMIKNLNERITTLSMDQMNAVRRYNRANKRVDEIHKELQQY
jgi:chromosome segregation ATPase